MKPITVLSLFDGMSCGQIALTELGVPISKYYASEVDKFAIQQTQHNFPNTIQLGSVVGVDVSKLDHIDLLIDGSPCQSFSFAGKRVGMSTKCNEEICTLERYLELKSEDFEFEGQSYLFWEYMRVLTDIRKYNPNVKFLLENVEMGSKWERVLSEAIGIYGVHINSSLVSAQNRKRIYWTNIRTRQEGLFGDIHSDIPQPQDKGIFLKDILKSEVDEKYYLSDKMIKCLSSRKEKAKQSNFQALEFSPIGIDEENIKARSINARLYKMGDADNYIKVDKNLKPKEDQAKASCFTAGGNSGGNHSDMDLIIQLGRGYNKGGLHQDKSPSMTSNSWEQNNLVVKESKVRRLTPYECSLLQTIPSWYKWIVSDTQQYRMLGNGWTIEVIIHILLFLKSSKQLSEAV